jgi:hypothetical protein
MSALDLAKIKQEFVSEISTNSALFLSNLGLGDQIDMIGAIRYLAQFHDQMHVPTFPRNYDTMAAFFADSPNIKLIRVDMQWYDEQLIKQKPHTQQEAIPYNPKDYTKVYRCGFLAYPYHPMWPDYVIPSCFYRDLQIDLSIEFTHFKIPESRESKELRSLLGGIPYIFVQQKASDCFTDLITWDRDEIFTIDPNVNPYPVGHRWNDLASRFVQKPFPHYTDTIIGATELHVVNSSFRCLSAHLPLQAKVKKCYQRGSGVHIPEWTFTRSNPNSPSQ